MYRKLLAVLSLFMIIGTTVFAQEESDRHIYYKLSEDQEEWTELQLNANYFPTDMSLANAVEIKVVGTWEFKPNDYPHIQNQFTRSATSSQHTSNTVVKKVDMSESKLIGNISALFVGFDALEEVVLGDISEVTSIAYICLETTKLRSIKGLYGITDRCTDMQYAFYHDMVLPEIDYTIVDPITGEVKTWDLSNVTSMSNAFNYCQKIEKLDLSSLSSKCNSITSMVSDCRNLTDMNYEGWDLSGVETAISSFYYTKIKTIDVSTISSKCTHTFALFSGCSELAEIETGSWDLSNVVDAHSMFSNCSKIKNVDVSSLSENCESIGAMFSDCSSLEWVSLGDVGESVVTDWLLVLPTTTFNFGNIFQRCSSLRYVYWNNAIPNLRERYEPNPNCLHFTSATTPASDIVPNVIVNGKADRNITLDDLHPYECPEEFDLNGHTAILTSTLNPKAAKPDGGWENFMLPFDGKVYGYTSMEKTESDVLDAVTKVDGGYYWLKEFKGNSDDAISFDVTTEDYLIANKPYAIALPGSFYTRYNMVGETIVFHSIGSTVPKTDIQEISGNDMTFTAATYPVESGLCYMLDDSGTQFVPVSPEDIGSFRSYMLIDSYAPAKAYRMTDMNIATSVSDVNNNEMANVMYSLDGRRITGKPSKGMYVMKGKKMAIIK